jgi:negative regulator of sigma E activity
VNHPDATEWMAFLYGEVAPERKRALDKHLVECSVCTKQVSAWRSGMSALDDWKIPVTRATTSWAMPVLKWAAAAAVVLCVGFVLGRQTSSANAELVELKTSVAQLADTLKRQQGEQLTNTVTLATAAANTETLRLLSGYSQLQAEQRYSDQQAIGTTLRSFETRLSRLRTELETVALNTENGFEQTHDNLTRLAAYSAPVPKDANLTTP